MKNILLTFSCIALLLSGCTKTTNNTTQMAPPNPAFTVNGITNVSIDHTAGGTILTVPFVVQYEDSVQQTVTVSVSGIPPTNGRTQDGLLATGIPTFDCTITFLYGGLNQIPLGTYPITITCVGTVSGTKTYKFNFVVF